MNNILDFTYDESGRPFAVTYTAGINDPVTYYYVLNLQGDVVGLLDVNRTLVAKYSYNAWGEILSITDAENADISGTSHIANINPLRYRGYYYDTETGFYYLQSRYYDPANHRFINADCYASTDASDAISCNMFAYCGNNPVDVFISTVRPTVRELAENTVKARAKEFGKSLVEDAVVGVVFGFVEKAYQKAVASYF